MAVLAYKEPWMLGNGLNNFRTIDSTYPLGVTISIIQDYLVYNLNGPVSSIVTECFYSIIF